MDRRRDAWHDGRRAWDRLTEGHPRDAKAALGALSDVRTVRYVLDEAELAAVRAARRHGRSWAEIATTLGVSRQSAWERWRDVDGSEEVEAAVASELIEAATRRRRSNVVVPDVTGLPWGDARDVLLERGLVGVGSDPDGPPIQAADWSAWVVVDQSPESGAKVPRGSSVIVWLERGGGSGVREPRRPSPAPLTAREMRLEPSDEAVG
jgi:hypothetical protein